MQNITHLIYKNCTMHPSLVLRVQGRIYWEMPNGSTYLERALVIHGGICVGKFCNKYSLKPTFQNGGHSKPLQWELWDRRQQRFQLRALPLLVISPCGQEAIVLCSCHSLRKS